MASVKKRLHGTSCQTNIAGYLQQRQYQATPSLSPLVRSRLAAAKSLYHKDLVGHFGCVNAIEFAHAVEGNACWIVSGGDDRRVLTWDLCESQFKKPDPVCMTGQHNSNIFCLSFDASNTRIFSGGNDEQVIYHDFPTGKTLDVYGHDDVVYGLSVDPNNINVFASAADDGKVRIYDVREPANTDSDPFCLADCGSSMHAVMYNPAEPRLIFTANNAHGVALWDIRRPKKYLMRYGSEFGEKQPHNCMSVRVNSLGTQLIALYRRQPLMLYNTESATPVAKFSSASGNHSTNYSNSCTMKSCSFAGDKDEYVLSGSDSFNVFMWEVPNIDYLSQKSTQVNVDKAHMLLQSHRSIVNQVRYCKSNHLLASSGVEKVIKIWSTFPIPGGEGDLLSESTLSKPDRVRFTPEQYLSIMLRQEMMHDYSNGDVDEDPHMMAFFDSLIQAGGDMSSSDDDSVDFIGPPQIGPHRFVLYSQSSSDSMDSEQEIVARLLSDVSSHSETNENNLLEGLTPSDPSAVNVTQDSHCRSESSSSTLESGSGTVSGSVSQTLPDTPYRAKAKKMVKRMRLLRQRVQNSDTSDTDTDDTPTNCTGGNHVQNNAGHNTSTDCERNNSSVRASSASVGNDNSITINSVSKECESLNGNISSNYDAMVCQSVTNNNVAPWCGSDQDRESQNELLSGTNKSSISALSKEAKMWKVTNKPIDCKKTVDNDTSACSNLRHLEEMNSNTSSLNPCIASTSSSGNSEHGLNDSVETVIHSKESLDSSTQLTSCEFKRIKKQNGRRQYRRRSNQPSLDDNGEDVP